MTFSFAKREKSHHALIELIFLNTCSDYPVHKFNGKKRVILSTATWIGGKNSFLGIAYIVVGTLCIVFGAVFLIVHLKVRTRYVLIAYPLLKTWLIKDASSFWFINVYLLFSIECHRLLRCKVVALMLWKSTWQEFSTINLLALE